MAEKSTFIKLDRNILKWGWYNDLPTFKLFIHLLLKANVADNEWQGITVKRGQLVTSLKHLEQQTDLSIQQLRTSLKKLNATHEVTNKTTNKYTIITVKNYDFYQTVTRTSTNHQQTNNKQITNKQQQYKNDKEIKNKRIEPVSPYERDPDLLNKPWTGTSGRTF